MSDHTTSSMPDRVTVGPFEYVRRQYHPKRKGDVPGHGWIREGPRPRSEVGAEAKVLIDEIVRLRSDNQAGSEAVTVTDCTGNSDG